MTDPREVTVTDGEIKAFLAAVNMTCPNALIPYFRQALAAFLAARVPDTKPNSGISLHVGFNACRDKVLKGV